MKTLVLVRLVASVMAQSVSTGAWQLAGTTGSGVQPAPAPTLTSLTVTPSTATQQNGGVAAFTATGTYSDGSTQNLTTSATWSSGNSVVATLGSTSTTQNFNCSSAGSSTVRATVGAINATASLTCTAPIGSGGNAYCTPSGTWIGPAMDAPASLPTACYYTALSSTPSPGIVRGPVNTVAAFNSAYSAAACGDVIQIAAGSSFTGPVTITGKGCDDQHYITIESTGVANVNFPTEGTRATPCMSNVASLPNRPTYPCSVPALLTAQFVAASSNSAVVLNGADHLRLIGIEFTRVSTPGALIYSLADLSSGGPTQTNHIIFDRVWFHGVPGTFPSTSTSTDTSTTRAIYLGQSNHVAVIDSYLSDFYDTSSMSANGNTDAQCMAGGMGSVPNSGWGVYKFVDNHCEASGEGILLGGGGGPALTPAGCTILVNCNVDTVADLEVRQNFFFKPLSWNGNTTVPGSTGWPVVKNGFEMKTGVRGLFEGNVIENCWYNAQGCASFSVAPINQQGGSPAVGTCPTCVVTDLTYRYNYSYNVAYGIAVYAMMAAGCSTCQSQGGNRISIHDNLIGDNLNLGNLVATSTGDAMEILATNDATGQGLNKLQNVSITHNTFVKAIRSMTVFGGPTDNTRIVNLTMQNNLWPYGNYGWVGVGSPGGCDTQANGSFYNALNECVTTWTVDHDAVFSWSTANGGTLGRNWPANGSGTGNWFYSGTSGPQFASYGIGDSGFNPANYQLLSTSPLHNAASDGKDVGVDIATLLSKIAGVRQ
jgi:hypothetical protein